MCNSSQASDVMVQQLRLLRKKPKCFHGLLKTIFSFVSSIRTKAFHKSSSEKIQMIEIIEMDELDGHWNFFKRTFLLQPIISLSYRLMTFDTFFVLQEDF